MKIWWRRIVRELDDFVFDRRAVARPDAADQIEAVERRAVQVLADYRVRMRRWYERPSTGVAGRRSAAALEYENSSGTSLGALLGHRVAVDRRPVDARRRPRLQPAASESPAARSACDETDRRRFAEPPFGAHVVAAKRLAAEKRAGREHDAARAQYALPSATTTPRTAPPSTSSPRPCRCTIVRFGCARSAVDAPRARTRACPSACAARAPPVPLLR